MAAGPSGVSIGVTRVQLFEFILNEKLFSQINTAHVQNQLVDWVRSRLTDSSIEEIHSTIKIFSMKLLKRWKISGRNKNSFFKRNNDWLLEELITPNVQQPQVPRSTLTGGPAVKEFSSLSTRMKRRRIQKLVASYSADELAFAAQTAFVKIGKRNVANFIKVATTTSSLKSLKTKKLSKNEIQPYTQDDALSLIIDTKITKAHYLKYRKGAKDRNCDIYPAYHKILKARKESYPEGIIINETSGEVKLQSLLNHTVQRLFGVQHEVVSRVVKEHHVSSLEMIYKWGFDGSSGHSLYKQGFIESADSTDSDLLLTSIVPLRMIARTSFGMSDEIVWMNPRPASTRFCIPIKIQFIKEGQDVIRRESEYIESQISTLIPTCIKTDGKDINVHHILLKTMLDGKVANALAENRSSQNCYICNATPKQMNDLKAVIERPCNTSTYIYGLSTLHAHIRFFECLLHISYRLSMQAWQVRGPDNKALFETKKREVISKFRQETGLLVDVVKQGAGTTNDGNTARRFFNDPKKAAEITGIDESLICRFSVILQAISCGYELQTEVFRKYALETAELFVKLYGWYYMPASVHKILIHGADVMNTLLLPIGQLSEESLEARHKECRFFREHNTRKMSRKNTIEDLLHALLISSDPLLSSLRPLPRRKSNPLPAEVINLVQEPKITPTRSPNVQDSESSTNEEQESEDSA